MRTIFGLRGRRLAVATVAIFAIAGGIAYAAIPDAGGVYHACMLKNTETIRIIEPGQAALQHGARDRDHVQPERAERRPGSPRARPDGAAAGSRRSKLFCGRRGDHATPAGTLRTCAAARDGARRRGRENGDGRRPPFSGTLHEPERQYSISVTDTGVTIQPGDDRGPLRHRAQGDAHASSSACSELERTHAEERHERDAAAGTSLSVFRQRQLPRCRARRARFDRRIDDPQRRVWVRAGRSPRRPCSPTSGNRGAISTGSSGGVADGLHRRLR